MSIRELDKNTAEQIAAGEVIENPASVVKELVENALDAGANKIEVQIKNGGRDLITVSDNGVGINAAELPLAFKRFATSKLVVLDDLSKLSSLGFRGEALPSIAAVARVLLTTREKGELSGSRIEIAGGEIIKQEEVGAPPGTRVEVTDLFYNTPGRLKFLRAGSAETSKISTLLSEMSLARPETAFSLTSGKRNLFSSAGDGVLLHAVGSLYGNETAEAMIPVRAGDDSTGCSLTGFISAPYLTRSTRRWITLVINGRLIRNPLLVNSLERAYGDLLPGQRHPVAILCLSIPPELIDVNVHPAKVEVRFQNPETVKKLIFRAAREALRDIRKLPAWPDQNSVPDYTSLQPGILQQGLLAEGPERFEAAAETYPDRKSSFYLEDMEGRAEPETKQGSGNCRLIGQFAQSYLVAQKGDRLLLIDQHAAHERINYHRLRAEDTVSNRELRSQLVIPITLSLPAGWRNRILKLLPVINEVGFDLEQLGEDNYVVRSVPFLLREDVSSAQIYDLLEQLLTADHPAGTDYKDSVLKTIACHRSIKAKQQLTRDEMEILLRDWEETPHSQYCPHGRPAVISFDRARLEKSFHRRES